MAHHAVPSGYGALITRLNRFPQGAPPSELLYQILSMLLSEKEASLVALLPIKPFTADKAAKAWKLDPKSAQNILDQLADRAILVDIEQNGETLYCLPPPMAGFFEFSLMRLRNDVNQKVLSELYYQYINVEEDFIRALFVDGETSLGRVFVQEQALPERVGLHVFDYERASEVILTAKGIGISMCYCRHKMAHMQRACDAPRDICMTFNTTASSLTRHGFARSVNTSECLEFLHAAYENNLVQFGENVRRGVNFICNCCGCCCEAMLAIRRFGLVHPIHSNFIAQISEAECTGCDLCSSVCPVEAVALERPDGSSGEKPGTARVDEKMCLGCGVCVRNCPAGALRLEPRTERVLTPLDTTHRTVLMAIERGTLPDLVFDNQVLLSHRALAAVLGVILRLPPLKRAMANRQLKSRYLESLLKRTPH
ncbi:MAG: 4Fe-4S dicluster domain-containing protein [Desulfomonile tiedjei]|uniref:4Fe-4S dicluster domain-containing protein n=1 Tax=Desulfomonile tiedjei TaxID=2358 RepID=A0A9D6V535_9BACT|nr:4Fe-4S dicluster domain-containing protein [Desulfomonile tiedjei]